MAMQYRWRDIPGMLRTPGGRRQVAGGVLFRAWPLLSRLARLHRRTAARRARVVAVVGSFGKSTTARAVTAALGTPEHPALTHNAWSSVARAVLRIRPWQRHAVIEAGISGPGQMRVYARMIRPDVTVVTSIGSEHHPAMPTLDVTRSEKAKMIEALPATGLAVLNGDDANVAWMALRAPCRVVTFGFGARCDVRASDLRLDWPRGMRFRVDAFGGARDASIRILGRQMVYPALAAIAVAVGEGVALDDAIARVGALPPTPGRMEAVALPDGAWVLRDDYKGTRETFEAALDLLDEIPARRKIAVFGDLSEVEGREWRLYVRLGMRTAGIVSRIVTVGRGFRRYWAGARKAGFPREAIVDGGRTVQEAAASLRRLLEPGDVVLIKSRRGQKLDRIRLLLEGRDVRCDIRHCEVRATECAQCPMLERGWGGHRVVTPGWHPPRARLAQAGPGRGSRRRTRARGR